MPDWTWEYKGYDPARERLREALCTLGNGYFATRGAAPETDAGPMHYPGTYVAGCYDRLTSYVGGRQVENEDMVNLPNWLPLRFRTRIGDAAPGKWFTPDNGSLLGYRQVLDLSRGTLSRSLLTEDRQGRRLRVEQERLVHMGDPHLAALRTVFTAENWSGSLEVEPGLDARVTNSGVARYRELNGRHLNRVHTGALEPDTLWLRCRTATSDVRVAMAARTRIVSDSMHDTGHPPLHAEPRIGPRQAAHRLLFRMEPGRSVTVDKTVALHTSRDPAISDPLHAALDAVRRAGPYERLLASHTVAWEQLWRGADLDVPGEPGRILRLHLFHLLQTLSPHVADLDVGVPARGLHGESYRGHVFWDEVFVLPFLDLHFPEISRALLNYRYRRLPAACRAAADAGHAGAMYPWQSGSDGREETQSLHLNPRSGRWLPDHSRLQHHVGSAVAYNIWTYCQASGDTEFLHTRGAEMLLQIARFWASVAQFDPALGRYRIRGVVGPDEFHEAYPDATRPGLDDNAYTNVTACWVLCRALELAGSLPEPRRRDLFERLELGEAELERWEEVSRKLHVPFHDGVVSQFEGYGELAELDWAAYRARYGDVGRLDRILESENDSVNRYQAAKQADVLMLGYLFSPAELRQLFERLGYALDDDSWAKTVDYYLARTSHGSTLSGLVHAWVLARERREEAWKYFLEALNADVADLQGGTTEEGIHLAAMAGTLDLVQRGLTGLETREEALWLDPAPPYELHQFGFSIRYRGHWGIALRAGPDELSVTVPPSEEPPIRAVLAGRAVTIAPGETCSLPLHGGEGTCD